MNLVAGDDTCENEIDDSYKENWSNCQAEDITVKEPLQYLLHFWCKTGDCEEGRGTYTKKRLLLKG